MEISGISVSPYLSSTGLAPFYSDSPDNHLPLISFTNLLEKIDEKEGFRPFLATYISNFEERFVSKVLQYILTAPNLLTCFGRAVETNEVILTNEKFTLLVNGTESLLRSNLDGRSSKGAAYLMALSIALVIDASKSYLGHEWEPTSLSAPPLVLGLLEHVFDARSTSTTSQENGYEIAFSTNGLLSSIYHGNRNDALDRTTPDAIKTIEGRIEALFDERPDAPILTLDEISKISDTSPRTLRRKLAGEGLTYFTVVDRWRFREAVRLIEKPRTSIKEIRSRLGYANNQNFSRAFKRWTNLSPSQYRQKIS